jgi:hypothetical protein
MRIDEFCDVHRACDEGREWARENCPTGMMSEAYEKLAKSENEEEKGYFAWTWARSFDQRTLRLIAVRMVRETPLADGRRVIDLLTDPRSLAALNVAERYANGMATDSDLAAAQDAASDAAWDAAKTVAGAVAWVAAKAVVWVTAKNVAWVAAGAAACNAARAEAKAAAWDAKAEAGAAAWVVASDAQLKILLSYGNPYAEGCNTC